MSTTLKFVEGTNFGLNVEDYRKGRRGYPQSMISRLSELTKGEKMKILDIGCGTGLLSIDLAKTFDKVIGFDFDTIMLKQAEIDKGSLPIEFKQGDVTKDLPTIFEPESFDLCTGAACWHWFTKTEEMAKSTCDGVRHILKPGGVIAIIGGLSNNLKPDNNNNNNNSVSPSSSSVTSIYKHEQDHSNEYLQTLFREIRDFLLTNYCKNLNNKKHPHENFNPFAILKKNGFDNVSQEFFSEEFEWTLEEMISTAKSSSYWNEIPFEDQVRADKGIREFLQAKLNDSGQKVFKRIKLTTLTYGFKK